LNSRGFYFIESDALRGKDYDETEIEDSISSKTDLRVILNFFSKKKTSYQFSILG
jgi:hypothetical protein